MERARLLASWLVGALFPMLYIVLVALPPLEMLPIPWRLLYYLTERVSFISGLFTLFVSMNFAGELGYTSKF